MEWTSVSTVRPIFDHRDGTLCHEMIKAMNMFARIGTFSMNTGVIRKVLPYVPVPDQDAGPAIDLLEIIGDGPNQLYLEIVVHADAIHNIGSLHVAADELPS